MRKLKKLDRVPSSDMEIKILIAPIAEAKREYCDIVIENTQESIRAGMERTKTELKRQGLGKGKNSYLTFYLNGSLKLVSPELDFEEFSEEVSDRIRQDTFIASEQTIDRMSGNVMDNIKDSYEAGYGIDKAAVNLQDVFDDMEDWELKRVARTEINGAQNLGAEATMRQLGVVYDKWKTAGDARVRGNRPEDTADHKYMDGQISYVSGNFSNGLSRPGDRSGPIKEWIQCRCVLLPYLMPEGYAAPSMSFFYESDLIPIEKPKPTERPKPGGKPKAPKPELPRERLRRGHIEGKELHGLNDKKRAELIERYYKENGVKISDKKSKEIYNAVKDFTGSDYSEIREIQRNGIEKFLKNHPKLNKKAANNYKKMADNLDDFLKNAPRYTEETIYRGIDINENMVSEIFKEGKTFLDEGVSSYSNIAGEARQHGNVVLQATNKSGISVKAFSSYSAESEILIPKGTKYMVKNIVKEKTDFGRTIIKIFMEEI